MIYVIGGFGLLCFIGVVYVFLEASMLEEVKAENRQLREWHKLLSQPLKRRWRE